MWRHVAVRQQRQWFTRAMLRVVLRRGVLQRRRGCAPFASSSPNPEGGESGAAFKIPRPMDRETLHSAWSFLQRANPFVVWGETVGREPSDGLPDFGELLRTVAGVSGKSSAEVSQYAQDAHASFERYVDDLGFERRSVMEIVAKEEAQTLDDFTTGAVAAKAYVLPRLGKSKAADARPDDDDDDLEAVLGAALIEAARAGAFADAAAPGAGTGDDADADADAQVVVARVAFGVRGSGVRLADLAPRSSGLMAWFERAVQRWRYEPCAPEGDQRGGDASAVLLRESTGLFVAAFDLAPDVVEALDGEAPKDAIDGFLRQTNLAWPVPNDALVRLPGDKDAAALSMRGWVFVDVLFPDATLTFAREVDRRADARWDMDWKVVDVDGKVAAHDHGRLLATFD